MICQCKMGSNWKQNCDILLNRLLEHDASIPFREPIDDEKYPDYREKILHPTDLSTIKQQWLAGLYASPSEFAKDVRQIFSNSKMYNTDRESKVHQLTLKLEEYFEAQFNHVMA